MQNEVDCSGMPNKDCFVMMYVGGNPKGEGSVHYSKVGTPTSFYEDKSLQQRSAAQENYSDLESMSG